MAKKLVIVESPAKAKTIGKILGGDYTVKASMGHVRDLPVSRLGVDIKNNFQPQYSVVAARKKVAAELQAAAKGCTDVYLCPDPDREGEAIAWHLKCLLESPKHPLAFHRVQYNEITPRAVQEAFAHPGEIDMRRVDAQQARRVLDRIVGYMVSPLLWSRLKRGLSAGRVQSVALKLVCDREKEIRDFTPEVFWLLGAVARKRVDPRDPFRLKLVRVNGEKADVGNEELAASIRAELEGCDLRVAAVRRREVQRRAAPPFITSTLQQAGSTFLNLSPSRTMRLAQSLYEGVDIGGATTGLITYMRTDSVNISQEARESCRQFVASQYGDDYVPGSPNQFRSRSGAQEAHEAIRPSDVARTPESLRSTLEGQEWKLYDLIWRRFVASQMAPARIEQRTADVVAARDPAPSREYLFSATSSDILFPGFMKVMGLETVNLKKADESAEGEPEELQKLPPVEEGERLDCVEWLSERKETQPPSRYSEAGLVRALEKNGVGRPSTYAATIATITDREYVTRLKKALFPTPLGEQVNAMLQENLPDLFDIGFTARMEDELDTVEKGGVEWTEMMAGFYAKFQVWMAAARGPSADRDAVVRVFALLDHVKTWGPEEKRGKRTYSDSKFVESLRKRMDDPEKAASRRQLEALARLAIRYREQIPDVEAELQKVGLESLLTDPQQQPPAEGTLRKLALLAGLELDERTTEFVASLRRRAEGGRSLSPAQEGALNSIVGKNASRIEGFEAMRADLALPEPQGEDTESGPLLAAAATVKEWKPAVTRGKRVFDDSEFVRSLTSQFATKKFLTDRQKAALRRLVGRYRTQILNFEAMAEALGLGPRKRDDDAT
jgi:DNA topoisomerase-1